MLVLVARLRLSLPSPRAVRLAKLGAQVLDLFVGEAGVAEAVEALEGGDLRGLAVRGTRGGGEWGTRMRREGVVEANLCRVFCALLVVLLDVAD